MTEATLSYHIRDHLFFIEDESSDWEEQKRTDIINEAALASSAAHARTHAKRDRIPLNRFSKIERVCCLVWYSTSVGVGPFFHFWRCISSRMQITLLLITHTSNVKRQSNTNIHLCFFVHSYISYRLSFDIFTTNEKKETKKKSFSVHPPHSIRL